MSLLYFKIKLTAASPAAIHHFYRDLQLHYINAVTHFVVPYFNGHSVVWIVDLVSDMRDHVLHNLRLVYEACTIAS